MVYTYRLSKGWVSTGFFFWKDTEGEGSCWALVSQNSLIAWNLTKKARCLGYSLLAFWIFSCLWLSSALPSLAAKGVFYQATASLSGRRMCVVSYWSAEDPSGQMGSYRCAPYHTDQVSDLKWVWASRTEPLFLKGKIWKQYLVKGCQARTRPLLTECPGCHPLCFCLFSLSLGATQWDFKSACRTWGHFTGIRLALSGFRWLLNGKCTERGLIWEVRFV